MEANRVVQENFFERALHLTGNYSKDAYMVANITWAEVAVAVTTGGWKPRY